jgi:hypothetical protein
MTPGQHLYIMQMDRTGAVKIGRSGNVDRRRNEVQTGCPYKVRIILVVKDKGPLERNLHRRLQRFRTGGFDGEWFEVDGLPSLPDWIYEQLDLELIDSWWRPS